MTSEFKELHNAIGDIYKIIDPFEKSIKQIDKLLNSNILSEDYVKKLCVTKVLLNSIIDKETEPIDLYKEKLIELEKNCQHNFVYEGHDSHHDYYKCTKCGKTERD